MRLASGDWDLIRYHSIQERFEQDPWFASEIARHGYGLQLVMQADVIASIQSNPTYLSEQERRERFPAYRLTQTNVSADGTTIRTREHPDFRLATRYEERYNLSGTSRFHLTDDQGHPLPTASAASSASGGAGRRYTEEEWRDWRAQQRGWQYRHDDSQWYWSYKSGWVRQDPYY